MVKMLRTGALLAAALLLAGTATAATYNVVKRDASGVTLDGSTNEAVWKDVPALNGEFQYPWEKEEAPSTVFKAFHDGENFYFAFVCKDKQVLVKKDFGDERATVDVEDRVELFFAPSAADQPVDYKLPTYYAVEVDALGRVHDYSIVYYRADMDSAWKMPGLKATGTLLPDGYSVECSIPLASLRQLGLLKADGTMLTGAYRAEFSGDVDKPDSIEMRWISWVDPKTPVPDFHVAASFGTFVFLP